MDHPLYYLDCYTFEFDAQVVENPTPTSVVLDKTSFYPTGGGQPNDIGTLITPDGGQFQVVNVLKREGHIIHELTGSAPPPGTMVHAIIDWDRRHVHMRMHTACHILCALIHKQTGAKITGNQIGIDHTRIDFNLETYDRAMLEKAVEVANEIIKKGSRITLAVLTQTDAAKIPDLVKLEEDRSAGLTAVRVVTIEGLDVQACGGTHVRDASEIGRIVLERVDNKGKSNRRVYFTLQ